MKRVIMFAAAVALSTAAYQASEPLSFISTDKDGTKTMYLDKKGIAQAQAGCVKQEMVWMETPEGQLYRIHRLCITETEHVR